MTIRLLFTLTFILFITRLNGQQTTKLKDLSAVSALSLNQDETPSPSKHRHAVEHLEPDPAKSIFNVMAGRNPLQRTTAVPRLNVANNKKHAGTVVVNGNSGWRGWFFLR